MDFVGLALSNEALGLYVIILVAGLGWLVSKGYVKKTYLDIAKDVFLFLEQNYKIWGISGNDKLEFFVSEFIDRYVNKFNVDATDDLIAKVTLLVENWVHEQHIVENRLPVEPVNTPVVEEVKPEVTQ
jgi:hypothetical protein